MKTSPKRPNEQIGIEYTINKKVDIASWHVHLFIYDVLPLSLTS